MAIQQAECNITVRASVLDLIIKTRMTIDLSLLSNIPWEADTNYRFELSDNFVRDANGVRSPLVKIDNLATINSGAIKCVISSQFSATADNIRNRIQSASASAAFSSTTTSRAILRPTVSLNPFFSISADNFTEYLAASYSVVENPDRLEGVNLFRIKNDQITLVPPTEWTTRNTALNNVTLSKGSTRVYSTRLQTGVYPPAHQIVIYNRNSDKPSLASTVNLPLPGSNRYYDVCKVIKSADDQLFLVALTDIRESGDPPPAYPPQRPRLYLYDNAFNELANIDFFGSNAYDGSIVDISWDTTATYILVTYFYRATVSDPSGRIYVRIYKRTGTTFTQLFNNYFLSAFYPGMALNAITPNGKFLYSAGYSSNTTSVSINYLTRTNDSISVSGGVNITGAINVVSMSISSNGQYLAVVTNNNNANGLGTLYVYTINQTTGELTQVSTTTVFINSVSNTQRHLSWSDNSVYLAFGGVSNGSNPLRVWKRTDNTFQELLIDMGSYPWINDPSNNLFNSVLGIDFSSV